MQIINNTSFKIIAFGWHEQYGAGDKVEIEPGKSGDVSGPYLGEMGGGNCHIALEGKITCHEGPDDKNGFHLSKGNYLNLKSDDKGVTILHHLEDCDFLFT